MEEHETHPVRDAAVLIGRLVLGGSIAAHGAQKMFGWFGGPGLEGAGGFFEKLGFRPGRDYARAASMTELGSGIAIALGIGGPLGPAAMASVMTTAAGSAHLKNGFFAQNQGYELNVMYGLGGLLLALDGYGNLSLDHLARLDSRRVPVWMRAAIFAGGIAAGVMMLSRREMQAPPEIKPSENSDAQSRETATV
jgi:putative oxidoreductase